MPAQWKLSGKILVKVINTVSGIHGLSRKVNSHLVFHSILFEGKMTCPNWIIKQKLKSVTRNRRQWMGVRKKGGAIWLHDGREFCSLKGSLGKMRCISSSWSAAGFFKDTEWNHNYNTNHCLLGPAVGLLSDVHTPTLILTPACCCIL